MATSSNKFNISATSHNTCLYFGSVSDKHSSLTITLNAAQIPLPVLWSKHCMPKYSKHFLWVFKSRRSQHISVRIPLIMSMSGFFSSGGSPKPLCNTRWKSTKV